MLQQYLLKTQDTAPHHTTPPWTNFRFRSRFPRQRGQSKRRMTRQRKYVDAIFVMPFLRENGRCTVFVFLFSSHGNPMGATHGLPMGFPRELRMGSHRLSAGFPWEAHGNSSVPWTAHGSPWEAHGQPMRRPWEHLVPMGVPWESHGRPMGFPWEAHANSLVPWETRGKPWDSDGNRFPLGSPRELLGPMGSPWEAHGKFIESQWEYPWKGRGKPMGTP